MNFIDPNGMYESKGPSADERSHIREGITYHTSWRWNPGRPEFQSNADAYFSWYATNEWLNSLLDATPDNGKLVIDYTSQTMTGYSAVTTSGIGLEDHTYYRVVSITNIDGVDFIGGPKSVSNDGAFYEDGSSLSYGSEFARERLQHIFHQGLENGAFNWQDAKHIGNNMFSVPTDFYKISYYLSFGTASMNIFMDFSTGVVYPTGFSDGWNLDPKPWGIRSYPAEILTRYYNWKLTGDNFSIRYP